MASLILESELMQDEVLVENLTNIINEKNSEIEDLMNEAESLRAELVGLKQVANYPQIGLGRTALQYRNDANRSFEPEDDEFDRYAKERSDYSWRKHASMLADKEFKHRHQDVSSTLFDTDPSGYYASGEDHIPEMPSLIRNKFGRDDYVGYALDRDVFAAEDFYPRGVSSSMRLQPSKYRRGVDDERIAELNAITESQEDKIDRYERRIAILEKLLESYDVEEITEITETTKTTDKPEETVNESTTKEHVEIIKAIMKANGFKEPKAKDIEFDEDFNDLVYYHDAKGDNLGKMIWESPIKVDGKTFKFEKLNTETGNLNVYYVSSDVDYTVTLRIFNVINENDEETKETKEVVNESAEIMPVGNRFLTVPSHLL